MNLKNIYFFVLMFFHCVAINGMWLPDIKREKSWESRLYTKALQLDDNKPGKHVAQWYLQTSFDNEITYQPMNISSENLIKKSNKDVHAIISYIDQSACFTNCTWFLLKKMDRRLPKSENRQLLTYMLCLPLDMNKHIFSYVLGTDLPPKAIKKLETLSLSDVWESLAWSKEYESKKHGQLTMADFFVLDSAEQCKMIVKYAGRANAYIPRCDLATIRSLPQEIKNHSVFHGIEYERDYEWRENIQHVVNAVKRPKSQQIMKLFGPVIGLLSPLVIRIIYGYEFNLMNYLLLASVGGYYGIACGVGVATCDSLEDIAGKNVVKYGSGSSSAMGALGALGVVYIAGDPINLAVAIPLWTASFYHLGVFLETFNERNPQQLKIKNSLDKI